MAAAPFVSPLSDSYHDQVRTFVHTYLLKYPWTLLDPLVGIVINWICVMYTSQFLWLVQRTNRSYWPICLSRVNHKLCVTKVTPCPCLSLLFSFLIFLFHLICIRFFLLFPILSNFPSVPEFFFVYQFALISFIPPSFFLTFLAFCHTLSLYFSLCYSAFLLSVSLILLLACFFRVSLSPPPFLRLFNSAVLLIQVRFLVPVFREHLLPTNLYIIVSN